jgi:nicotinamide-nucleotide amidase
MDEGDPSPQAAAGSLLTERAETLAVAESCTGGLIGSQITDVPGASDYFDRAVVSYSYDAKRDLLAVSREALDEHGAVSEPVARQMARGVRDTADTTWGVATTGVAGPTGGSTDTPVGTAFIAVAYAAPWGTNDSTVSVARYEFDGDRDAVKAAVADQALRDLVGAIEARAEPPDQ